MFYFDFSFLFIDRTGDSNPLHTDESYASTTQFKRCIVHGVLMNGFVLEK